MQVFVSHSSVDGPAAAHLRNLWLAERPDDRILLSSEHGAGPAGGELWQSWIRNAVTNCDVVVFVASEHSSSPWCSAELGMAQLLARPVVPLHTGGSGHINPVIAHVQASPLDQPIESILQAIDRRVGEPSRPWLPRDFVPYPGLSPLTEDQEAILFGRLAERDRIVDAFDDIGQAKVIVVSGPSGSGKSSLLRAGIIPWLRRDGWSVIGPTQPKQLSSKGLPEFGDDRRRVVVVDQFEELLVVDPDQRMAIAGWIAAAIEAGVWSLVVVRSEFRTDVGHHLPKPIDVYVPYPGREDLYEIVRGPAKLANLGLAEQLVDRLVGETGTGDALPLLAYTMHELWRARNTGTNELSEADLDRLGGVGGVLERRASAALRAATDGDPERVRPVLSTLARLASPTQIPPTRSPARLDTFSARDRNHLDPFARAGLISYSTSYAPEDRLDLDIRPTGTDLADVTHEALFDWLPLAEVIAEERGRNVERDTIERTARRWDAGSRTDETLLLAGDRLAFAVAEELGRQGPLLRDFVAASETEARSRRRRRRAVEAIIVFSIIAIAAAAFAWMERGRATRAEVVARSVRLAAQSRDAIDSQRDVAMLAAVAGYQTNPNPETEGALIDALATPQGPVRYYVGESADWSTLRLLDRGRGVVATDRLRAAVIDLETLEVALLGVGSELDRVEVDELSPIAGTSLILFRGTVPPATAVAGAVELGSDRVIAVEHSVPITAFAGTREILVFGDADGGVHVAPLGAGANGGHETADRHEGEITSVAVTADGRWIAAASTRGVRIGPWPPGNDGAATDLRVVEPGGRNSERITFSPDEPYELFGAGSDPEIRRWRHSSDGFQEADRLGEHIGSVEAIMVSPDGRSIFTAGLGGTIERWNRSGAPIGDGLEAHRLDVIALSAVEDNLLLSNDTNTATLWDLSIERTIERTGFVPEAWTDRSIVGLVTGPGPLAVLTTDDRVLVDDGRDLDGPPGATRGWWAGETLVVERQSLDPSGGDGGLWAVSDSQQQELAVNIDAAAASRCLAAHAAGPTIRFIDVGGCGDAPEPVRVDADGHVVAMAFSFDGRRLIAARSTGRIDEIDIGDGTIVTTTASNQPTRVTGLGWIDDRTIAVGHDRGGNTVVIDLAAARDQAVILELTGHDDAVQSITTDREGRRLYLAGADGRITQTSLAEGRTIGAPIIGRQRRAENDPNAIVRGLRLVADDTVLLAIHGFELVAWELEPERLVAEACWRAGRALTTAEAQALGLDDPSPC